MSNAHGWYEVITHKTHIYILRERLSEVDPRFHTIYTNMYLLLGSEKALLIDTGAGVCPIKPLIDDIVKDRELLVINTHSHFDHRGGNHEFEKIYIHKSEVSNARQVFDVSFLKDSSKPIVSNYSKNDFKLLPAKEIIPIQDGKQFDLGGLSMKIIHTPGHSIGSISLLSDRDELFTGDTAHYGSMYLPRRKTFPVFISSLRKLSELYENHPDLEIYPSHEDFPASKDLLEKLTDGIANLEKIWSSKRWDKFLSAWIIDDDNFKYVII
jgi:glyoxylase-like metal-dependent hydrolase (beta-lactamase superfamily II)